MAKMMSICIYLMLLIEALLWFEHWIVGFLYEISLCYNGSEVCSYFLLKVVWAVVGLSVCCIMMLRPYKLRMHIPLAVFIFSLIADIVLFSVAVRREDDCSPKSVVFYPCGLTLEERHGN